MSNPFLVGGCEPRCDLLREVNRLTLRQRAIVEQLAEFFAFEKFGNDEWRSFVGTDVVDGEDIRVVERGGGAGFLLKAQQAIGITGERGRKHLDRHIAVKSGVACSIDFTHPTRAEFDDDFIMGDRL